MLKAESITAEINGNAIIKAGPLRVYEKLKIIKVKLFLLRINSIY